MSVAPSGHVATVAVHGVGIASACRGFWVLWLTSPSQHELCLLVQGVSFLRAL